MLTATSSTTTDRRYIISGTREDELQATVEAIDRYLDLKSGLSWYEFGEKMIYDKLLRHATDHIIHILKTYKEWQKIR